MFWCLGIAPVRNMLLRHEQIFELINDSWRWEEIMNIYVGNIAYQTTEEELKATFQAYGDVEKVRVITDRETGRAKGFAFVEMPSSEQANAAIEALNGKEIGGRKIAVNEARPKPAHSGAGGGGHRGGGRDFGGGGHRGGGKRF